MNTAVQVTQIPVLLRGETKSVVAWIRQWDWSRVRAWVAVTVLGAALFGAAIGWWRAPLQAFYTAAKFPLVLLLTALGNAVLNAMLAPLLGVNMGLRQSLLAVLMSFTIAAAILGAFAPLQFFVAWNVPSFNLELRSAFLGYRFMQFATVSFIAFAGVMANVRLLPLLRAHAETDAAALRVLFAWLAGNLFLGSQICWVLRPFVGLPQAPVEFLGPGLFQGSFYEEVFQALRAVLLQQAEVGL
ncbi:MAG: hypothetical protein HZA89_13860 [Verrucomicrobia bacterium]|nr:hypothetical protein [Verrucomicrobiota bacterium]